MERDEERWTFNKGPMEKCILASYVLQKFVEEFRANPNQSNYNIIFGQGTFPFKAKDSFYVSDHLAVQIENIRIKVSGENPLGKFGDYIITHIDQEISKEI